MAERILTAARLREVIHYQPLTGEFTWKTACCRKIKVGDKAGTIGKSGYVDIRIDGCKYRAHRLAILYMTGEWPVDGVDHANRLSGDNRYENLRQCTQGENNRNRQVKRKTATGVKGVSLAEAGKYRARIALDGQRKLIGVFKTLSEAADAYRLAAARLHGKFSCV